MFLELIGVIFAGFAAAGLVMLLGKLLGGRLPRWLAPVAAGLAMIAATITSEYGWYARSAAALPEGVVVAQTVENRSFYRPWTYAVPYVDRFAAVDTATLKSHADHPGIYLADVYFFGRWSAVQKRPVWLDCAGGRRALATTGTPFTDGRPAAENWIPAAEDDPILRVACGA